MGDIGTVVFVLALTVTFLYPRVAGVVGLASSLLCLQLYLYFIAPVSMSSRVDRLAASTGTDGRWRECSPSQLPRISACAVSRKPVRRDSRPKDSSPSNRLFPHPASESDHRGGSRAPALRFRVE